MRKRVALIPLLLATALSATVQAAELKEELRQVLRENPEIIYEVIQQNPLKFMEVLQTAAKQAEMQAAIAKQAQEKQEFEAAFSKPLKPEIRKDEAIRGPKNAPLVLVEYSDFQCPYCQRGYNTVMELMNKYDGKIQFIYKHLPLDFHEAARPASYY